tara:strand:+ start:10025 stop:11557 length:1533 start_codon:yes stop_codon:yes gene_type:complete
LEAIKIPYKETENFSKIVLDYISEKKELKKFINDFPDIDSLGKQIKLKSSQKLDRVSLVSALEKQYENIDVSKQTLQNIQLLNNKQTFTITTGHQLCLFTGPLYFIYKIASAINLVQSLNKKYPKNNFVPVFWLASEDHDFEEVNSINLYREKILWETKQSGPVGRMKPHGIKLLIDEIRHVLGEGELVDRVINLFKNAYNKKNLSLATRFLVDELFSDFGVVVLDADIPILKKQLIPIIKKDVIENKFYNLIKDTADQLSQDYHIQAKVRKINFFRIKENSRERIDVASSEEDIFNNYAEYSPNVLIRPLYQELILPNLAYIGGGAEIAYWMLLRTSFVDSKIPMPLIILRNSALILSKPQAHKLNKLEIKDQQLFKNIDRLKKDYVMRNNLTISFEKELVNLNKIYDAIFLKTKDISMHSSIESMKTKNIQMFEKSENKLIKFTKDRDLIEINQIEKIMKILFPISSLQERHDNFTSYYCRYGENFIKILVQNLNPLDTNFVILKLEK